MKSKNLIFTISTIALLLIVLSFTTFAQTIVGDTMYCPASAYGSPGALRNLIAGDTLSNGQRKNINRVYKLERGGIYWWDASLEINAPLTIVADDDNPSKPTPPPIFAPAVLADGSSAGSWINHKKGNLYLKNIYFQYWRPTDKKQVGWSVPVNSYPDSVRITIKGCIFDGQSGNAITYNGKWCKVYIEDCYFKNGQHPTAFFGGGAVHGNNSGPVDTLVFVNNTGFCNTGYFVLVHNHVHNYVRIEHNTLVYNCVNVFYDYYSRNISIKNNLIYSGISMGASKAQKEEGWFDKYTDVPSLISTDTITKTLFQATGVTEASRKYRVESNVYFWPQAVKDYWKNDSVAYPPVWMNSRTLGMFTDKNTWPGFYQANNKEADPQFGATVTNQISKFVQYLHLVRTSTQTDFLYTYDPRNDIFTVVWPLTENFSYSANLTGTDGLPVGDLNWFPDKKKIWKTLAVETVNSTIPEKYTLEQNYPNPFNPSTKIKFSIPKEGFVTLKVYNMIGQEVATLVNENLKAGSYESTFDAKNLSSGVYFYTLKANNFSSTAKMVLMK